MVNFSSPTSFEDELVESCARNEEFHATMLACCPILLLGIIGNALVFIITKKNKEMRNPTNILLTNISVSDLLFLLLQTPTTIAYSFNIAIHGQESIHDFLMSLQDACYINSMITITLLARERYMALFYALEPQRHLKKSGIKIAIGLIWLFAIVSGFLNIICTKLSKDIVKVLTIIWVLLLCVVPTGLTMYFYAKIIIGICISNTICGQGETTAEETESRKRTVKMLILVTLFAAVSKIPFQIIYMIYLNGNEEMFCTVAMIWTITCIASCLIPIVYFTMCANFKNGLKHLCQCCLCRGRNVIVSE